MIIWGSRTRYSTTEEGVFYCPSEQGDRPYARKTAKQWFTLYFIPIFPMNERGEVVECQTCNNQFAPGVLDLPTTTQLSQTLTAAMRYAVASVIAVDGTVLDVEKEAAVAVMLRYDADSTDDHLNADLEVVCHDHALDDLAQCAASLDQFGKETLIAHLGYLAGVDGSTSEAEYTLIQAAGQTLSMSPAHLNGVLGRIGQASNEAR